jgi:hypothetical protein
MWRESSYGILTSVASLYLGKTFTDRNTRIVVACSIVHFNFDLSDDAISTVGYLTSTGAIISEWTGEDLEEGGTVIICSTIPTYDSKEAETRFI